MLQKLWWYVRPFWYNSETWQTDRCLDDGENRIKTRYKNLENGPFGQCHLRTTSNAAVAFLYGGGSRGRGQWLCPMLSRLPPHPLTLSLDFMLNGTTNNAACSCDFGAIHKTVKELAYNNLLTYSTLQPTSPLHSLLPPHRDQLPITCLRAASKFPRIPTRTKKYQSFLLYALADYQT